MGATPWRFKSSHPHSQNKRLECDNEEPDPGFLCLSDRAPEVPDDSTLDTLTTICLHCLIDEHPEIGEGLDLARANGTALLDDEGWYA